MGLSSSPEHLITFNNVTSHKILMFQTEVVWVYMARMVSRKQDHCHQSFIHISISILRFNCFADDFNHNICKRCVCSTTANKKTVVDCSNRNLWHIPENLPPNLVSLNLQINNISEISNGSLYGCEHLQTLDLSANNLVHIDRNAFEGTSIRDLYLNDNRLILNSTDAVHLVSVLWTKVWKYCQYKIMLYVLMKSSLVRTVWRNSPLTDHWRAGLDESYRCYQTWTNWVSTTNQAI